MRLVSLTCSNTELLAALGLTDQLVGVDSHSDLPEVAHLPRLGPDLDIDLARLEALRPDLVLSSLSVPGMERVVAGIEARGLPQRVLDPISWADVLDNLRQVGGELGVSARAEQVISDLEAEVASLRRTFARPPRVAVEWWPRPVIVAGRDSWISDMLRELGAQNAFGHLEVRSRPVTLEELEVADPDLLVVSWCGVRKLRPEVARARGLRARVAAIPEAGLGRPGPRLIEGYRALAAALSPFA
ncbi:iron complex transport system substrate-binding protein [Deinobacterium chartae]|uniref:Iron complex transport system substrate-binding protein n=1 Tax=Deinobacterium chartae TaxID=521158 RepID=A0A841HVT1_9DEIO|nr:helical backbone metal receptor [Deinobacterium chartae]MBB6097621.1 iron complex transport system substrate-binding protein [Deinobacterium chartae]